MILPEKLRSVIAVARGEKPAALLLTGGTVANVFTREITAGNVAVEGAVIAGVGPEYTRGREVIDLSGKTLIPGLIDAHLHLESTLLTPPELARAALRHGTTAVIADPHEIANVLGEAGITYLLEAASGLPLDFFFTVPSCVPATTMETAGAEIDESLVERLLENPRMLGLAEMMNYPGVLGGDPAVLAKIAAARRKGKLIDGHAPGLSGAELQAYAGSGIATDHECVTAAEALEKVRCGMMVIVRQGSAARNLADLLPAVKQAGSDRFMFGSDDRDAADLLAAGHLDEILRRAVSLGLDPLTAVQMATLNPARHYGLARRGALAPGWLADLVAVDDLTAFRVKLVVKGGRVVVREGVLEAEIESQIPPGAVLDTVRLPRPLRAEDFTLRRGEAAGLFPVIGIIPGQIVTEKLYLEPPLGPGGAVAGDPQRDLLKLAVVERHRGTGRIGLGLVKGMGLREGAVASSVAHDSHNLIVAGVQEAAMAAAANELARAGGGFVAVDGRGAVRALLPLPVAGLLSAGSAEEVAAGVERVTGAARSLGATPENPFLTLSFLALPVIPHLKLTDRGLFDVDAFRLI